MTTDRWTNADETKLQSMIKRKADIMEKNKAPVVELARKFHFWFVDSKAPVEDMLIENAKQIRDVLEPFDDRIYTARF